MNNIKIETIFDLMKNKDSKGFELLYKYHFRTIYGVALSITKNEVKSYDVVQNVLLKLYQLPYEKYPHSNELTWLYTVSKNEALQLLRKNKPVINIESIVELPDMNTTIDEFADMDSYYSMITSLNENQKNIVTLKVLGGLSHKEISQMLGKPIGTIQWIYNTSIKKLRVVLATLSVFVLTSASAFMHRLKTYFDGLNIQIPESYPPTEVIPVQPRVDIYLILFGILFFISICGWIIFFKKSDKLPTK